MRLCLFSLLPLVTGSFAAAADLPVSVPISGKAGEYTKERWKADWPGCEFEGGVKDGRVFVIEQMEHVPKVLTAPNGEAYVIEEREQKWLRVNFAVGKIGPEEGGAGWRWPVGRHEQAELRYTLRFSKDFDFVKGGKLPGLCGGPENVSGGRPADGKNGFSARLMWRKDGRGEAYVYHKNQKGNYGDSFAFPEDFRFPMNQPVTVRLAVGMNTPGQKDGTLRVWITTEGNKEKLMVEKKDMEWRTVDSFGVDGLYFETFHGGGDKSWAPTRPCSVEFKDMSVVKPAAE